MLRWIVEIILAVYMLVLPSAEAGVTVAASAEPMVAAETSVEAEVYSHQSEGVMLARFENILNHNYCFGEDFLSEERLVLGAQLALSSECVDGYIPCAVVDNFVYEMYGRDSSKVNLDFADKKEGYYPVLPRSFSTYRHTVTDYEYVGDGSIKVYTDVVIDPDGEAVAAKCESLLFADGASIFGYTLLSCNLY